MVMHSLMQIHVHVLYIHVIFKLKISRQLYLPAAKDFHESH